MTKAFSCSLSGKLLSAFAGGALLLAGVLAGGAAPSFSAPFDDVDGMPVNFQAKQLSHDDKAQTVTAIGDVELVQGKRILRADKMVYNLGTDTVSAIGNVSLLDETGDVHFAEYVELNRSMKDGFVHSLLSLLADGSRFTAVEARREGGTKTTMTDATYTPCKVCEANPDPLWQIRASEVVHDAGNKSVKYRNARLEIFDIPLAYTPVFSHADPSVKRKSGFLRPSYGWTSDLGTYVKGGYYFGDIAPDKDATLSVQPSTRAGTLVEGQWRQRFKDGRVQLDASAVQSDRKEQDGRIEQNRLRGHVFADGQFDLDDKWRAGFGIERASDKGYLRFYDISDENVLDNEVYAERFSGRDYSRVAALSFQDVRLGTRPDLPDALPMAEHRMTGAPGRMLGGRWTAGVSALALNRDDLGQDMQRASLEAGWERRDILPQGIVLTTDLAGRGDFYTVQNREAALANPALDDEAKAARGMATAGMVGSYPLVRQLEKAQALVEPIAGISLSPQADDTDEDIPNEDSLDVQLDTSNLFDANRFPGVDRQEDGARVSYGLKTGMHYHDGKYVKAFVGQSYRFDDDLIFPQNSGLDDNSSDIVGLVNVGLSGFSADYRFQMDNEDLSAHRHEAVARANAGRLSLNTRYLYIDSTAGTGFTEAREQVNVGTGYRLTDHWRVNAGALTDLGEEPGLRRAAFGASYADECLSFSAQGVRNLTTDASGEHETLIMLRLGLKNIGEFKSPQILLSGKEED